MISIPWRLIGLAVILFLCGAGLYGAYRHGVTITNALWQDRWDREVQAQAEERATAEASARVIEQQHQKAIDEVAIHATQALEQVRTDAATANSAAGRLREQAAKLAAAASRCTGNPGAASSGAPVANPGNLLAVVLDKSVQRNRELAAVADTARVKGLACEAAYDALVKPK